MAGSSSRNALRFIWDGQNGLFELADRPHSRYHLTKETALSSLNGMRYFGPLARKQNGSKKVDIADVGNVLWVDIDSLSAPEHLARLPVAPSLFLFSGDKGYWAYYKLSRPIATERIEQLNRGLATVLEGDSCHNRDRIARLPGSIHNNSGRRAEIVSFSKAVYDPDDLAFLAVCLWARRRSSTSSTRCDRCSTQVLSGITSTATQLVRRQCQGRSGRNLMFARFARGPRLNTLLLRRPLWPDGHLRLRHRTSPRGVDRPPLGRPRHPNGWVNVNKVCVDGEIRNDQGKTDAAFRTVALQRRALDALSALPRPIRSDRLLFPAPRGGLIDLDNWRARHWARAVIESGLEPRPLYQMRHTYASLSLAAGADIYWVSEQMGHRDIRVTLKHYARFQRRSAVDERNLRLLAAYGYQGPEDVFEGPNAARSLDET